MKINYQFNKYAEAYNNSRKRNNGDDNRYIFSSPKISFSANPLKVVDGNKITYKNIGKIVEGIDGVLGKDGYLASQLEKANLSPQNGELVLKQEKFLDALLSTVKYPFVEMPFELVNCLGKAIQKTPFSKFGDKIVNNKIIKAKIGQIDAKNSYELVSKILEQFCDKEELFHHDIGKLTDYFKHTTANKITKNAKAYASRDERTLNRLVTGGIGALLSAVDMYNISMLEKNDKTSAKKAEKSRRNQELIRVGLSAGLTFLTLGIFDKYTKGDLHKTAYIIAGSTLFSEIVSRIAKHKSLVPLSPEKAKKIAENQEEAKKSKEKLSFTKIALDKVNNNDKVGLFKDFTDSKNNQETTGNITNFQPQQTTKAKNRHIPLKLLAAVVLCSGGYLVSHKLKGEYAQKVARKALLESNDKKIQEFLESGDISVLPKKLLKEIKEVTEKKDGIFDTLKKKITKREVEIDLSYLQTELDKLLASDASQDIEPVIKLYRDQVEFLKSKGDSRYTQKIERKVASSLYEGVTKLFNTLNTLFSYPGKGITSIREKQFSESEKIFKNIEVLIDKQDSSKLKKQYEKQLSELNEIFQEYGNKKNGYKKIAKYINSHARNFEKSAETGDLANFSRTLVSLIASYFYVNDFRNTVLIESKGENVQRAKEVTNDSISFKLCNFFFNGTLMNLFNSFGKSILNGSLLGATIIPAATEFTNEILIRKTISRPMKKMGSRDEIIEYERSKANRKGFAGWWTRTFKKLTGQKSLVEKYENSKNK